MHDNPSSAGKKKNKMPRGDRASLAGASLADDAGMRVSVTWEQVNPDAQRAPMTDIDNLNLPKVTPPSPSKLPPLRDAPHPPPPVVTERSSSSTAMDLDDVPVTGAPHKDFETLLQEQLAKEGGGGGMGGGAVPAKNAKTPPGATPRSASARKFLRKGARNERTTLTPPGIKASHPTLKPSKTAGSKATASHTSKTIDYGFDDSEPIEDVKPKAVKPKGGRGRVPSPGATKRQDARLARENDEAAELAEFEALERELAVVDPSSEQRTAPGPSFGGGGGMGGGAVPAKNAKTPPGATPRSASARKFLRKGARNERTTLTPPGIKASHPTLKPSKTAGSKATASHTSKTIDYGFDDSEPIEDVKPKAVKPKGGRGRVPSPGATKRQDARLARENDEAAELAEFEALERELAVVDPSSEQRTAPGPSFKPAAKKSAQAAALRAAATRALEDENGESDSSDGDDAFAVEDHFGGALRSASHVKGPSVPVAFDDDEEFSEDEAADAAAYDNYPQNDHFRRAEPSSMGVNSNSVDTNRRAIESVSGAAASVHDDAPGDGAPALIQSLFYNGNEGRKGSRVGSRVVNAGYEPDAGAKRLPNSGSLSTKANSDAAMAKAQAAAASAAEVKAAADDASARVKRERDRLEREKSAFAQEKRAAARERQTWEKQRKDATASIASEREEIKADADRLRRDRQRLERDSKRVLSALPTKKERTEMDDLREKLARAQEDQRAKDTKQRHTVDRLRAQIADLQTECAELKGEKRRLEQQILDGGAQGAPKRYEMDDDAEEERRADELREREAEEEERAARRREREQRDREDRERELELERERELRERRRREVERSAAAEKAAAAERAKADKARKAEKTLAAAAAGSSGGVTAAEAAAAHKLPSVHDPPPRVGPPPSPESSEVTSAETITHDDGRVERVLPRGRRVVHFANGTLKDIVPSTEGPISTVYFTNGDVKRTHPGGRVEYFYREVDTWHTTHPGGVEVYHFPSGQTEAHGPDGYKEILFPDGLLRKVHADGREEDTVVN